MLDVISTAPFNKRHLGNWIQERAIDLCFSGGNEMHLLQLQIGGHTQLKKPRESMAS